MFPVLTKSNHFYLHAADQFHVSTKTIAVDFSNAEGIYSTIADEIKGLDIGILVNNVGVSHPYPEYFLDIADLNNVSITSNKHSCGVMGIESSHIQRNDEACKAMKAHTKLILTFISRVLPFFVVTNMSRLKKASLDKPDPGTYVRAALATVGLRSRTCGYLPHSIMVITLSFSSALGHKKFVHVFGFLPFLNVGVISIIRMNPGWAKEMYPILKFIIN
uniref:Hydroxysteroid (17-beta) dehydrogenase 12a n=1 Tax=Eptatretus burgeri TaxID=7764 RepID=A0A8C4QE29_EPTBU